MDIKKQWKLLTDNWLIALIVLVLIFIAGSFNFNIPSTLNTFSGLGGGSSRGIAVDEKYTSSAIAPGIGEDASFSPDAQTRILTQSAYLSSEVKKGKFQDADKQVRDIIKTTDSFLLDENVIQHESQFRQYYTGNYVIRVEASKYDSVVNQLRGIGKVQEFTKGIDDITNGYTKLEIEIVAEKDRLARYEALYKEAKTVEDKLSLSDRIYNQERTIKYYEDALTGMNEDVEYSSVTVQINEKHSDYAGVKFISFGTLINNLVTGINNLLTIIFFLLPYGILAWLIYYGFRWWKRGQGRRK
ncbi:MAG: DUF4349 domain-containing protein [Patescibacteria group bacterium]|jgi:hypothetical protein